MKILRIWTTYEQCTTMSWYKQNCKRNNGGRDKCERSKTNINVMGEIICRGVWKYELSKHLNHDIGCWWFQQSLQHKHKSLIVSASCLKSKLPLYTHLLAKMKDLKVEHPLWMELPAEDLHLLSPFPSHFQHVTPLIFSMVDS